MANAIDLALLPALTIIEQVDFETALTRYVELGEISDPSPTNPAYRVCLAAAYREVALKQEANEQARGVMLAFAVDAQLDHLGHTYYKHANAAPVERLTGESNFSYRSRLQQSSGGLSVAGPSPAYEFHARSASASVKDVTVISPAPVEIELVILTQEGNGSASDALCRQIEDYLAPFRPMSDLVYAVSAEIRHYDVIAKLRIDNKVDNAETLINAKNSALDYINQRKYLGGDVVESALHTALSVKGVLEVKLQNWTDIKCTSRQAPHCDDFQLSELII